MKDAQRRWINACALASITSLALAISVALWWALNPNAYEGATTTATSAGQVVSQTERASFLAVNGAWALVPLAIPAALAALGLFGAVRGNRTLVWVAAVVLLVFCFLAALSIGMFYLPAAIALLVAALASRRELPAQ